MARVYRSRPDDSKPKIWQFSLDDEEFTCTLRQDADAVMEWSEMAGTAIGAEGSDDLESAAGIAFTARFFKLMMEQAEYLRFRAHLRKHHTSQEILVEIMQDVNDEMQKLIEKSTDRPTAPSSSSSRGGAAKEDRTLTIISLEEGEYETVDAPLPVPRQERRAAQRKATKKRAG